MCMNQKTLGNYALKKLCLIKSSAKQPAYLVYMFEVHACACVNTFKDMCVRVYVRVCVHACRVCVWVMYFMHMRKT